MMYRARSDVWFNLPGVVAAYQPIAAPGSLVARYSQANGGDNRYRAVPITSPVAAWSPLTGWTGTGSEFFEIAYQQKSAVFSAAVRFSNVAGSGNRSPLGWYEQGTNSAMLIQIETASMGAYNGANYPAGYVTNAPAMTEGTYIIAGKSVYRNGILEASSIPAGSISNTVSSMSLLAARHPDYGFIQRFVGSLQAVALYERVLSYAEVWNVNRQMAYCHANPDWSAWCRRRRYYYAPSAAAGAAKMNTYFRRMRS